MGNLAATVSYTCQGSQSFITLDSLTPPAGATAPVVYRWQVQNTATGNDYGGPVDLSQLPLSVPVPDGPYLVLVLAEDAAQQSYATDGISYEVDCASGTGPGQPGGGGSGCQDEYADNYDPTATSGGSASCTYTPHWRSAWGPEGVSVRVAAVAGQTEAFVRVTLRAGFRDGHPLASQRPLVEVATLRATVGPDGYATFVLAPYLRPLLGAPDGAGGYRYDLNSPTAYTNDLYVGYELRRPDGTLLAHGYVLNAAVPDGALTPTVPGSNVAITPFQRLPIWPGFSDYGVVQVGTVSFTDGLALLGTLNAADCPDLVQLPCPPTPLPVAWLAPGGGYGYWVFQGKPLLQDLIEMSSTYQEAATGERRYSERGTARRSYTASSGPFRGAALAEGLATLARSPQVWVQPVVGGPWVAVTLEAGTFPVARWGQRRNELTGIVFTEARPHYQQGQ